MSANTGVVPVCITSLAAALNAERLDASAISSALGAGGPNGITLSRCDEERERGLSGMATAGLRQRPYHVEGGRQRSPGARNYPE
jgi:hypothetical protein